MKGTWKGAKLASAWHIVLFATHPPLQYFSLLVFSQPHPYLPSALVCLLVPVSSCDLSSMQKHLINYLTFPQAHFFSLSLRPVS